MGDDAVCICYRLLEKIVSREELQRGKVTLKDSSAWGEGRREGINSVAGRTSPPRWVHLLPMLGRDHRRGSTIPGNSGQAGSTGAHGS